MSDEEAELFDDDGPEEPTAAGSQRPKKVKRSRIAQFIDDEAELSGDDLVSDDEPDLSDDDQIDPELVDLDAKDLESDEEEEIRRLYHKQLDADDRRQVLLLQEQLEENEIAFGPQRRRKFRWQAKELMEDSLKRHYDPDDDDTQEELDDDDDIDYGAIEPRLRRPTGALTLGSTKIITDTGVNRVMELLNDDESLSNSNLGALRTYSRMKSKTYDADPSLMSDESNSNTINDRFTIATNRSTATVNADMKRYLFRDKEVVQALSTRETVVVTREDKDRVIQRELKRVLQSDSIFDQLYS